ncbi:MULTISPECIES: hypothetical protein [unclassified Enterococcus]|jgi:hypothetical protein|uniref:hypothetical protein n=1 Tax=unclassified Enterococcus TaxID=2608891 RepID=UPI000353AFCC|nr:hypothetical protein D920_02498 [Enterococcus faecalis 13-SD-W-01]
MNPYVETIQELVDGKIDQIEVKRENVILFREAWLQREDRKFVVGEAQLGGHVIYRYDPTRLY